MRNKHKRESERESNNFTLCELARISREKARRSSIREREEKREYALTLGHPLLCMVQSRERETACLMGGCLALLEKHTRELCFDLQGRACWHME